MIEKAERRIKTLINGKWRIDSLVGSGAMASVYGATHRNGARAALKILHTELCTDQAVCERFLGEAYLTNSVKHEGIVQVFDDGMTDDGAVFLAMDLLEGRTLEALRVERGGRIGVRETLDLADALMDVLHVVHGAQLIHRDLKPQNVFVCHDGSVKVLDFGIARIDDGAAHSQSSLFGLVLGTPAFMSPEQASGAREKVDQRSDIWSLGATLFTVLTGQTVHLGPSARAKLVAAATVRPRSISMVMPELPLPVAMAIDKALRFDQAERWQTVDAFRRAFAEARAQLTLDEEEAAAATGAPFDQAEPAAPADEAMPDEAAADEAAPIRGEGDGALGVVLAATADDPSDEASYPAVGNTLERFAADDIDLIIIPGVRRARLGTWLVASACAVAVLGGAAFLALNPADDPQRSAAAPPTPTFTASAPDTAPPATAPAEAPSPPPTAARESSVLIVAPAAIASVAKSAASASTPPPLRTARVVVPRASRKLEPSRAAPIPAKAPPPAIEAAAVPTVWAPAPSSAPELFGTPD